MSTDELNAKLNDIENRIKQKRDELEHRGLLNKGHKLTQQDLNKRAQILRKELEEEVASLQTGRKVHELEREFLNWLNAVDLDAR